MEQQLGSLLVKYAAFFALCGAALVYVANAADALVAVVWPVTTCGALALAYLLNRPTLLGKRPDGTISPVAWFVFGPWFLFSAFVLFVVRKLSKEAAYDRLGNVYLGRRLVGGELPDAIQHIVDLTSEFIEPRSLRMRTGYRAFPLLDARGTDARRLVAFVETIPSDAPVFIHCAQGHGRTGLVAAAMLLKVGAAKTPDAAIALLRGTRPGVHLNAEQRATLNEVAASVGRV